MVFFSGNRHPETVTEPGPKWTYGTLLGYTGKIGIWRSIHYKQPLIVGETPRNSRWPRISNLHHTVSSLHVGSCGHLLGIHMGCRRVRSCIGQRTWYDLHLKWGSLWKAGPGRRHRVETRDILGSHPGRSGTIPEEVRIFHIHHPEYLGFQDRLLGQENGLSSKGFHL